MPGKARAPQESDQDMRRMLQSSIEFISVYGMTFLIIVGATSILYLFSTMPQSILPFSCSVYSGLSCHDIAYSQAAAGTNAVLTILVSESQFGIMNISAFDAVVDGVNSIRGSCSPSRLTEGQNATCTANVPSQINQGQLYKGIFVLKANYCTASLSEDEQCQASADYDFAGSFMVQGFGSRG